MNQFIETAEEEKNLFINEQFLKIATDGVMKL